MGYHIPHCLRTLRRAEGADLRDAMPREAVARQPLSADIDGFNLHAAMRVEAHDHKWLETAVPLHHPASAFRRAGGAQAQTPWREGHHAPSDDDL